MSIITADLARYGPTHCERLSVADAAAYTRRLARLHGENFHVISRMLPADLRQDFANVYAFCRWADDLGDEVGNADRSLALLRWWGVQLDQCYESRCEHPVYIALAETIRRHNLPQQPFADLISAFEQDQRIARYQTWDQLLEYCRRSANPVGRLVLMMCGHRDEQRMQLADQTCTALQLANHWQDIRRDILERDRIYLPNEIAAGHGLDLEALADAVRRSAREGDTAQAFRSRLGSALRQAVLQTWPLFRRGRELWRLVGREIRPVLRLFTFGGEAVLRRIEQGGFDTAQTRPALGRVAKAAIMGRVWLMGLGERR